MDERILILDFGSQVTQLIARRVREGGVYCEIRPYAIPAAEIERIAPRGIILSGGPASVTDAAAPRPDVEVFSLGIPLLGICYGQQAMCEALGGTVKPSARREFGRAQLDIVEPCSLFDGVWRVGAREQVWMSHGDAVAVMPQGFRAVAKTEAAPLAAIADDRRGFYGIQFHPEVVHTPSGAALLENFARGVAGCRGDWSMASFRARAIESIRARVGHGRVVCGLSGGVDSSVSAILLHEAIADRLTCVFVDTGLMRRGEAEEVAGLFRDHYNIPFVQEDAASVFLKRLAGVTDPEEKRKIIGATFIDIFEHAARRADNADFLAQGTLYPDVIESVPVAGPSAVIKSHHNVGGLPERMKLRLIEPLRALFKDEVRVLGRELGMPDSLVGRHPFPGPGLAIRLPGEVTAEKLAILRQADAILIEEIRSAGLYDTIWQAFAVLLPVRTVGVMGDARTYEHVCALRAVTSEDGMTADFHRFDMGFLGAVANRIVNEVRGINRVVYDVTSKPPGTIEWE